jgi:uncharacterized membrane protein
LLAEAGCKLAQHGVVRFVGDTAERILRRLAALHGLLGFLFNAIIIALTVNIAAGLL